MAKKNANSDLGGNMVSPEAKGKSEVVIFVRFIDRKIRCYTNEEFDAIKDDYTGRTLKEETNYFYKNVMELKNVNRKELSDTIEVRSKLMEVIKSGEHERTLEFIMNIQHTQKSKLGTMAQIDDTWKKESVTLIGN